MSCHYICRTLNQQLKQNLMKIKLQFVVATILFMNATIWAQVPGYVPSTNLICWYGFSGNTNNSANASNHLVNTGATATTDRFNTPNAAYQFNGTNQFMSVPTPTFSFASTGSFTVSWWMKRSTAGYGVALMSGVSGGGSFVWNFQTSTNLDMQFGTNKQGGAWTWAQGTYSTGQWLHLLGTYANGSMVFYVNGVQVATATYSQTGAQQTIMPLWVGRGVSGANFNGQIDDIGIWDRVLTPAEISILYSGCTLAVTSQPKAVSAIMGATAKFGVATSNVAATFQWQQNLGSGFANISNSGQFFGATADTVVVSNLIMANNTNQFRCVITESTSCADTSNSATLSVCGAISTNPVNQSVQAGTPVVFTASNTDPNATYQWQIATIGAFGNLFNGPVFTGVTTDSLKLTTTAPINNNQKFRCIVKSGTCTDTTTEAVLNVTNIGIDENQNAAFSLYPNPANEVLTLQLAAQTENQTYSIVNQVGIVLLSGQITEIKTSIDISKLPSGFYFFKIGDATPQRFSVVR